MAIVAIKAENIGKQYSIGKIRKPTIKETFSNLFAGGFKKEEKFWSLKDISFELKEGEVLGIIGKNGAGKSTLLKVLSQITEPNTGQIEINGRVASLLEVGTGFHPELTGRENIFMNGIILGMHRQEIKAKFDEIVNFAGVEKFIDTPVKHYSSGMQVRLGFAVAAHLEPDILIVDEVLAVGDFEFQKKCLGKMQDVSHKQGRTVLFVSHQMDAVSRLCPRSILLENGKVKFDGPTEKAIKIYYNKKEGQGAQVELNIKDSDNRVLLKKVSIKGKNGILNDHADVRDELKIQIEYQVVVDHLVVSAGINVHNENGDHLFTSHDVHAMINQMPKKSGCYLATVSIPPNLLSEGVIYISAALMRYEPFVVYCHEEKVLVLNITDDVDGTSARGIYSGFFPGLVRPKLEWETKILVTND